MLPSTQSLDYEPFYAISQLFSIHTIILKMPKNGLHTPFVPTLVIIFTALLKICIVLVHAVIGQMHELLIAIMAFWRFIELR